MMVHVCIFEACLGFGVGVGGNRGRVEKGIGYLTLDYDIE
jgi:hypothetical protein